MANEFLAQAVQENVKKPGYFIDDSGNRYQLADFYYIKDDKPVDKYKNLIENISGQNFYTAQKVTDNTIKIISNMGLRTHHSVSNAFNSFTADNLNYGLALDKFPVFLNDKFHFVDSEKNKLFYQVNPNEVLIKEIIHKTDNLLKLMEQQGFIITKKNYTLDWRIVVGLGTESVYENGLTLHPVYGLPYIPGSGVKGIIRGYVIQICFDGNEALALKTPDFVSIFGDGLDTDENTGNRGKVVFLDAFPTTSPTIKADILNPHFNKFFDTKGKTPPADYFEPVPVSFLSVEKTTFQFSIAVLNNDNQPIQAKFGSKSYDTHFETSAYTMHWLERALTEAGAGAKTSSGYGQFKPNKIN